MEHSATFKQALKDFLKELGHCDKYYKNIAYSPYQARKRLQICSDLTLSFLKHPIIKSLDLNLGIEEVSDTFVYIRYERSKEMHQKINERIRSKFSYVPHSIFLIEDIHKDFKSLSENTNTRLMSIEKKENLNAFFQQFEVLLGSEINSWLMDRKLNNSLQLHQDIKTRKIKI